MAIAADADVLRERLGTAAGQMIKTGIGALTGAVDREKSVERWG